MENSVTKPFRFDLSQSQQFNLNSNQSTIFQLGSKFFMCPFFCQVWAFSESEWFSLNMESWHRKFSIFFLNCDTRLSVMSWSHLLLMRSICCASDAVGHLEFIEVRQFVTLSFVWLLLIEKWWMHWMVPNKEGSGLCRFNRFFLPMIWELVRSNRY